VFEEDNHVQHYVGGYSDWVKRGKALEDKESPDSVIRQAELASETEQPVAPVKKKLSYKFQRELDMMPETIENLEEQIGVLQEQLADPSFYDKPYEETQPVLDEANNLQAELDRCIERWAELEDM